MKAQITIFIIIGLFLVIVLGVTLYVSTLFVSGQKIVDLDFKDFVSDCLKQSAEFSFQELSLGGGFLKEENVERIDYDGNLFSVLINKPKMDVCLDNGDCLFFALPWQYPWVKFPFDDSLQEKSFIGYFGVSSFPSFDLIKNKLELDIRNRFLECVDDFQALSVLGVDVNGDFNPVVDLIFYNLSYLSEEGLSQDRFTVVNLYYDLTKKDSFSVSKEDVFSVRLPVRFSYLYYAIENIINKDISNISYIPSAEGLLVDVIKKEGFSLVNITDLSSSLFGSSLNFVFARENRYPALWFVDLPRRTFHVSPGGTPTKLSINNNKLVIKDPCDDLIEIPLNASDPDEDPLFFKVEPNELKLNDESFKIIVSDGLLEDYQLFEVNVVLCPV
jgi:hypothetical protein